MWTSRLTLLKAWLRPLSNWDTRRYYLRRVAVGLPVGPWFWRVETRSPALKKNLWRLWFLSPNRRAGLLSSHPRPAHQPHVVLQANRLNERRPQRHLYRCSPALNASAAPMVWVAIFVGDRGAEPDIPTDERRSRRRKRRLRSASNQSGRRLRDQAHHLCAPSANSGRRSVRAKTAAVCARQARLSSSSPAPPCR